MFYNARWYDPALGRFAQGDSIVPEGVQGWDRYAYVNNNPVKFIDPSGHKICFGMLSTECVPTQGSYGIIIKGNFTPDQKKAIHQAVADTAYTLWFYTDYPTPWQAFRQIMGIVIFIFDPNAKIRGWAETVVDTITYDNSINIEHASIPNIIRSVAHELGHIFDIRTGLKGSGDMWTTIYDAEGNYVTGINSEGNWVRTNTGYGSDWYPDQMHPADDFGGQSTIEEFADMFMNWVYDSFAQDLEGYAAGQARFDFMTTNMAVWISSVTR